MHLLAQALLEDIRCLPCDSAVKITRLIQEERFSNLAKYQGTQIVAF
jgi:hypothetical protein